ncbi:MAG: RluA family pseudouridine synthase [Gemmatimonadota bacterium]|nr:RluA family pseudouridine synthase [Gemmatimonadota bacterium]
MKEDQVEILLVERAGDRLDTYVAGNSDLSRARVQALIKDGRVSVNGHVGRKSERLKIGQCIEVRVPPPQVLTLQPEAIPLDIVFEDRSLVVVNKEAGMVTHPGPGHPGGTLVNALLAHVKNLSGIGGKLRPGIVHRLDRFTSGLMVVAKSDKAHQALSEALRRREMKRLYLSASWGHLSESPLDVEAPIGRSRIDRQRMAVVESGRYAKTRFRVLERWLGAELLEVALGTGRTHQIRVHLAHIGHPVVGDEVYGVGWERGIGGVARQWAQELNRRVSRQFLHAWRLSFRHPSSGKALRFEASLPADLNTCAEWARSE